MTQPWQEPPIKARETECKDYLEEAVASGDVDLLEEMSAKMNDVLIVWRRSQKRESVHFTDGQLREMALSHAVEEVFGDELDAEATRDREIAELTFRAAVNDFSLAAMRESLDHHHSERGV